MPQQPDIPRRQEAELTEIEAALGSLAPAPSRLDRDLVLFRAGQARPVRSRPTSSRLWPALAASLAALAIVQGVMLAARPGPRVVERIVYIATPAAPSVSQTPAPAVAEAESQAGPPAEVMILSRADGRRRAPESTWPEFFHYLQMRQDILKGGVDALPEPPPLAMFAGGKAPQSSRELLQTELESLLTPGNPS